LRTRKKRRDGIVTIALLAGITAFFATFVIGVAATSRWQCDGVCTDLFDEILLVSLAVGVFCALSAAWITWERVTRRPEDG
jgi:hypothetical protein